MRTIRGQIRPEVTQRALPKRYRSVMASCRTCGGSIWWQRKNGKNHALDLDGKNHWINCKPVRKLEIRFGGRIIGKDYRPSCGECGLDPWFVCACTPKEWLA